MEGTKTKRAFQKQKLVSRQGSGEVGKSNDFQIIDIFIEEVSTSENVSIKLLLINRFTNK